MNTISTFNQVKLHNVNLIKNTLRSIPSGTKNSVAQITGLSIATCNTILNELAESGEIIPVESEIPLVGRPPKSYQFNKDFAYICCICLMVQSEQKFINCAIVDLLGNIIFQQSFRFEKIGYKEISSLLNEKIKAEPRIQYISVGFPGYYHAGKLDSCGIEELNGCDLIGLLKKEFQIPVFWENDMNAIAYGSYTKKQRPSETENTFVMISFFKDTGLGSGIIVNEKLIHGNTNFAGEILYLPYSETDTLDLLRQGKQAVINCAAMALSCYCAILNPALVSFTGENLSEEMLEPIRQKCLKKIPEEHLPDLYYENDYLQTYITGLSQIVFDSLF